jgi:hypothetical protein
METVSAYLSSGEEEAEEVAPQPLAVRVDMVPNVDVAAATEMRSYVNPNTKQLMINPTHEALSQPGPAQYRCPLLPVATTRVRSRLTWLCAARSARPPEPFPAEWAAFKAADEPGERAVVGGWNQRVLIR